MARFGIECKQCGAQISVDELQHIVTCPYCESKNTVSKAGESKSGLFNRANYLRRNCEFDRAIEACEDILNQDNSDYEAHWCLLISKYGIEYVEDPSTGKRIPTCHRVQYDSILLDPEYQSACEYAPDMVRSVYEEEAAYIDKVQKAILALAQRQEQYDVFLCYKETGENGERSADSVLAQELEFELSKRGYRVFFARKTLAGKLGVDYESVIFAALHSAKVMVVLGTTSEHFNAVWVKNEWSRYRELIKKGEQKTLIPAYRGMSPYDLPKEFASLQALDMGKLGFVQDLCDGIDKLSKPRGKEDTRSDATAAPGVSSLMRRAELFLEDGDLDQAKQYIERALDIDPEYAPAYIGKLLVELKLRREDQLSANGNPLTEYANYQKAIRFADVALKAKYEGYNTAILNRIEDARRERKYQQAETLFHRYESSSDLIYAAEQYRHLSGYKDSDEKAHTCERLTEEARIKEDRQAEERRLNNIEIGRKRKELYAQSAKYQARRKRIMRVAVIVCAVLVIVIIVLVAQVFFL